MRGPGQIAALAALARPRVARGDERRHRAPRRCSARREAIARREGRARRRAARRRASRCCPHGEPLLAPSLRAGLRVRTFGEDAGADAALLAREPVPGGQRRGLRVGADEARSSWRSARAATRRSTCGGAGRVAARSACRWTTRRGGAAGIRLQRWRGEVLRAARRRRAHQRRLQREPASLARRPGGARRARRWPAGASPCWARWRSSATTAPALHAASGAEAAERGVDVLVAVGPAGGGLPGGRRAGGRGPPGGRRGGRRGAAGDARAAGRRRARQGHRARPAWRAWRQGWRGVWRIESLRDQVLAAGVLAIVISIAAGAAASSRSCGATASARTSARRGRRGTRPSRARRRWAAS